MPIYLVYGPSGCGKKSMCLGYIQKKTDMDLLQYYHENTVALSPPIEEMIPFVETFDCFKVNDTETNEPQRKDWFSRVDYCGSNIETEALCFWNVDELPLLWQRGLLTKLEDWNRRDTFPVFMTARSLTRVDKAFVSRCVLLRMESKYKEILATKCHWTDYDCISAHHHHHSKEDILYKHVDNIWKNFLEKKPDTDHQIKDLFLWGVMPTEMVHAFLQVFGNMYNESLDTMAAIVGHVSAWNLKKIEWFHIVDWLISIRKIIS